jgi:release factor glutamine methyltransferase
MITVLEAINLSTQYLEKKGVESARLNAELLLAHILNCKRLNLYLMFDKPLNESELNIYREYIYRRGKREPLQYIIGYTEFYNVRIKTDSRALIPRPETELLVETVLEFYKDKTDISFLDIGTGTGCITISLLKNLKGSEALAIDISEKSLELAKENLLLNNLENSCKLLYFNALCNNYRTLGEFDFIVSNPPYVSKDDFENLLPELKNYEPKVALTDNEDGLKFYKAIIKNSFFILKKNGKLFLEINPSMASLITDLMKDYNYIDINLKKDFNNHYRIIYGEKG